MPELPPDLQVRSMALQAAASALQRRALVHSEPSHEFKELVKSFEQFIKNGTWTAR